MSIQIGRWHFDGWPADRPFLLRASEVASQYPADREFPLVTGPLSLIVRRLDTTAEDRQAPAEIPTSGGVLLAWDGRLDNRTELQSLVGFRPNESAPDAEIALRAFLRWNTQSFAKFLGDWALSVWDPAAQTLYLAKDFVGTRPLYYALERDSITWSTALDPLVLLTERTFRISEEFLCGYLSTFPASHLTPYVGVHAVPAASYVAIQKARVHVAEYWQCDPSRTIIYRTDREYEEQFRALFAESVRRRLRSSTPVVAELSGGMDSSSIVSVADRLLAQGNAECPRLDTISYYDDDEPNWNERPYFSLVERCRGRVGHHISSGSVDHAFLPSEDVPFLPFPGVDRRMAAFVSQVNGFVRACGARVLLSGIGGDEFLGGVPNPLPGLQDDLLGLHWARAAQQIVRFSLAERRPVAHLAFATVEPFLPQSIRRRYTRPRIPPWLAPSLVARNLRVFWRDTPRRTFSGGRPSFQEAQNALYHLRRYLSCCSVPGGAHYRVTYPFLDRDLLTFLMAIPYEQLLRPNQRRSLMRRALAGIVPAEILLRKRKASIARRPLVRIEASLPAIRRLLVSPILADYGWIDRAQLVSAVDVARDGDSAYATPLTKTIQLELWLEALIERGVLAITRGQRTVSVEQPHHDSTEFNPSRVES